MASCLFNSIASLFLLPGEHSIKWTFFFFFFILVPPFFFFAGSVGALAPERVCEFYLCSGCLITIFHHVKQIEDNEGLGDLVGGVVVVGEGGGGERLCAAYKEINLFAVRYKGLLLEKDPHWLCIGD